MNLDNTIYAELPGLKGTDFRPLFEEAKFSRRDTRLVVYHLISGDLPDMMKSVLAFMKGDHGAFEDFQQKRKEKYLATRDTPERLAKSQAKLSELTGTEPDRRPIDAEKKIVRNPAFTIFWLPWARAAQYFQETDIDLSASEYGIDYTQKLRTVVHSSLSCSSLCPQKADDRISHHTVPRP